MNRGAVRKGNWKLVKFASLPSKVELYDLKGDPGKKNNVAKHHPEMVNELEDILNQYAKQAKGSLFFKEYMPFVKHDINNAEMVYMGDEDGGQPGEIPALPKCEIMSPVKGMQPSVEAFWSITIYNAKNFLVDNPINRYAIGNRTPSLKTNKDGSLTIYIRKNSPADDKKVNWLPAAVTKSN